MAACTGKTSKKPNPSSSPHTQLTDSLQRSYYTYYCSIALPEVYYFCYQWCGFFSTGRASKRSFMGPPFPFAQQIVSLSMKHNASALPCVHQRRWELQVLHRHFPSQTRPCLQFVISSVSVGLDCVIMTVGKEVLLLFASSLRVCLRSHFRPPHLSQFPPALNPGPRRSPIHGNRRKSDRVELAGFSLRCSVFFFSLSTSLDSACCCLRSVSVVKGPCDTELHPGKERLLLNDPSCVQI